LVLGLVIKGLASGLLTEKIVRTQGIGADLMVQPPQSSYLLGLGKNVLPASMAEKLLEVEGVEAATPVASEASFTNRLEMVLGIDLESFSRVSGGFRYTAGEPFTGPYTALVDDIYTRTHHVGLGSRMTFLNREFTICGIVEHGKGGRVFVPLATLQDLVAPEKCAVIFVKCSPSDPAEAVRVRLKEFHGGALQNYQITLLRELTTLLTPSAIVGLQEFLVVVVGFAAVINFLVIFLALYTQVLAHTREIGILRALGATRNYIINMVLGEALLLALVGASLGLVAYQLTKTILLSVFPGLSFLLPLGFTVEIVAVALVSAVLGASYPAYRAARSEPIVVLSYE
ncbi:MAG: FtsX-like permease family protein, partial [Acidobacteria bacterium]|nr:FtsX-like permease family protein [Acidobacteriota bacterium]